MSLFKYNNIELFWYRKKVGMNEISENEYTWSSFNIFKKTFQSCHLEELHSVYKATVGQLLKS